MNKIKLYQTSFESAIIEYKITLLCLFSCSVSTSFDWQCSFMHQYLIKTVKINWYSYERNFLFNDFELNCTFWYKSKRYARFLLVLLTKKQRDLTALPQESKEGIPWTWSSHYQGSCLAVNSPFGNYNRFFNQISYSLEFFKSHPICLLTYVCVFEKVFKFLLFLICAFWCE